MRWVGPCAAVVVAVLWPAAPAAAHGADAPSGTNYRTVVSAVSPPLDGLTVRAVEAGGRLELTNGTGRTIEVLGYDGEPYLEVRPDGVFANTRSPTYYTNATLGGGSGVPPTADPAAAPSWQRVSASPVARWHDHRTHWMGTSPPPAVAADPGRTHRVRDWVVPLRDGVSTVEVTGTLDWVPPPVAGLWWALALVGALLVGLLGLRWDRALPALCLLAVLGGLVAIGYAVARELDAGAASVGGVLAGLARGQVWPVLTGVASIAAAGYALRRRRGAGDLALGLAGACLALISGATNAAILARSVAPVPFAPVWARALTALLIALGAGLAVARGCTSARSPGRPGTRRRRDDPRPRIRAPLDQPAPRLIIAIPLGMAPSLAAMTPFPAGLR